MTIREYLLMRTRQRFAATLKALEGVTEEQAVADRRENWPLHDYHVAQDGSILGLVCHLAAWKETWIEYFRGNVVDQRSVVPENLTFAEAVAWLERANAAWLEAAAAIPEEALETPLNLPVDPWHTPLNMIQEIHDHEVEHCGQINYLIEARKCASV
jgi:uncharacterized damage-inducible protein DinB